MNFDDNVLHIQNDSSKPVIISVTEKDVTKHVFEKAKEMHLKNLEFEEIVQKLMFEELKISSSQERDVDVSLTVFPKSKVTVNYGRCSVQIKGG